jgi:hypothetical protein
MLHNLKKFGAALPESLMIVEELDKSFMIDTKAPKFTGERKTGCDPISTELAENLLENSRLIGAHISDNDQEIWFLSQAGEIFRSTGEGTPKFYAVDAEEASLMLDGYADEQALEVLTNLGLYEPERAPQP